MQMINLSCALLATVLLAGCNAPPKENRSTQVDRPSQAQPVNPDLLSPDGELFPLSAFFGVCVRYKGVWDSELRSGPPGPHYPTGGEITLAGRIKLKIGVGKFGILPGATFKDISATSLPRRIQIGRDRFGSSLVLVSDFAGAGNNRVSIEYDVKDSDAEAAAIRLANEVVACHVSAVPVNAKGE